MIRIILGILLTAYGIFILGWPQVYFRWLKRQARTVKSDTPVRYLWQTRVRGIIYMVVGIIFFLAGVLS